LIEAYLREAPFLHLYELGDLDPREAPHCEWVVGDRAVVLVYRGLATPTVVALAHDDPWPVRELLAAHAPRLPARLYLHATGGVAPALAPAFAFESLGTHHKMGLTREVAGGRDDVVPLAPADADEALAFYRVSYPGAYFEPGNLARGPYLALRDRDGIAAIAGVHVYAPTIGVAALGNIATRPDVRGRGLAGAVTGALARQLQREGVLVGLNVKADNPAAIACYARLGFEQVASYEEFRATRY
jgi:ribosomal protein S18 acetylase RimI-like enzyme